MKETRFLKRGRVDWQKLDRQAARLGSLTSAELLEFVSLYRKATSDLARARTLGARSDVVDYLNRLVGRIHFQIYTTPSFSLRRFASFFAWTFPAAVRRNRGYLLASALLLLVPALLGYLSVAARPELIRVFAPPEFVELIEKYGTVETGGAEQVSYMTSFYVTHNSQVAFVTFVSGLLLGAGSAWFLVQNGAILGAMLAAVVGVGQARPFLAYVSAHGGVEMTAIVLAGAAGLRVGLSLLNPGEVRRSRALIEAGRDAGLLMLGVIAMLAIAAILEAWTSHSSLPAGVKWTAGIVNLGLVVAYFSLAGRERRAATSPAPASR